MFDTTVEGKIRRRIINSNDGTIFMFSDFEDISKSSRVGTALIMCKNEGLILPIVRGVYEKPKFNMRKKYVPIPINTIAKAIAMNLGWGISPTGETALYMIGFSDKKPIEWEFISSGATKTYDYRGTKIKFKHTENKNILEYSSITLLVIETLKKLGRNNINLGDIGDISRLLPLSQKILIINETNGMNSWIFEYLKLICME